MVTLIEGLGALVGFVDPIQRQPHRILVDADDVFAFVSLEATSLTLPFASLSLFNVYISTSICNI